MPRARIRLLLFALCGLATVGSGCAGLDESDLEPARGTFENPAQTFSIEIPNEEWLVVPLEAVEEPTPDFLLARKGASGWLRAYSSNALTLEDLVVGRRSEILAGGAFNYREKRYFLGHENEIVASLARYVQGSEVVLVMAAIRPPFAVELIAGAGRARGTEREILRILESVRFAGGEGAE